MARITIAPADGNWTVRTEDGILVESRDALALTEGSMAPVIYFPRADVAMALLDRTETTTKCPNKGVANYYAYVGQSARIEDVAWTYEDITNAEAKGVEGHLAFYGTKVTVERV